MPIRIQLNTEGIKQVQAKLAQLQRKAGNLTLVLEDIGEELKISTDDRWEQEIDPSGKKWAKLKSSTWQSKRDRGARRGILQDSGQLRNTITYQVSGNSLEIGSNLPYAASHQLGSDPYTIRPKRKKILYFNGRFAKKVNHPGQTARPFLGVSKQDEQAIERIIDKYLDL